MARRIITIKTGTSHDHSNPARTSPPRISRVVDRHDDRREPVDHATVFSRADLVHARRGVDAVADVVGGKTLLGEDPVVCGCWCSRRADRPYYSPTVAR